MPIETLSESSRARVQNSPYRKTIAPVFLRGSHAADDTLNHDYRFEARGKSRLTVLLSSTGGSTHNLTIYGAMNDTGGIGEQGVTQISDVATINGTTGGYLNSTGAFPHFIVRVQTDTLGAEQGVGPTVNLFIGLNN